MTEIAYGPGVGRRITRYGTILAASGILCKLMLLVYTVLAIDILGREGFGRIEYFIEMAIVFSVLSDFGLEQTVTREIARARDRLHDHLYPLLVYRLVVSVLGGVCMVVLLKALARPGHSWALILCALTYFFAIANMMLIRAVARSFEWLSFEGLANVLDKIIHIGLAIFFLLTWPRLPVILLCYTAGALVSVAIYFTLILRRCGYRRTSYTVQNWIDWQKLALPIGLSAACILLLHREDTLMVNWIRGDGETGLYRAPYRFLEGLFLFPQVLAISAYPVFSKMYHDRQPFADTAANLLRGLSIVCLPITVGGTYIASDMMGTLAPELGEAGGEIFRILVWSLPFIYANFLLGTILNATDRQSRNFRASAWGLISNAVLNVPAIYWYGAIGASWITIASQGLYCVMMAWDTRDFRLIRDRKRYAAIVAACAVMFGVLELAGLNWFYSIFLGVAIYPAALIAFRGVSKKDLRNMTRIASPK